MQHESTQKLVGGDGHLALLAAVGIVFPAEGDLAVGNIQNPMIGDGDAVKCNAPGTEARAPALRTGVWHRPPNLDERGGGGKHERRSLWPEAEGCRGTRVRLAERRASSQLQAGDKFAAKDTARYLHGQEERVARMDPALVVERQTTSRDHTMNVRMMSQILAPGVEHTQKADFRSEMFGVGGDLQQSRGAGTEQEIVCRSAPAWCRWVAQLWRKVCGETCLVMPALWAASRQAYHGILSLMGTSARQLFTVPGNR